MLLKLAALFGIFAGSLLVNMCLGEVRLSPAAAINVLCNSFSTVTLHTQSDTNVATSVVAEMLWQIRLPRLIAAAVVGAALAVSGYLLQALSRNYLADPYLTGVSSGSALAVATVLLLGINLAFLPAAALIGGLVAATIVASMSRVSAGLSITRLLLGGIAVSSVCSSLITLVLTSFSNTSRAQGLVYWLAGSVSGRTWAELQPPAIYVAAGLIAAMVLSKPLRLLSLGTQSAAALGVNVPRVQWMILITAVILCGSAVSLSGVVGFVGLVAPYIARSWMGADERIHLVGAVLIGASLVALSDLFARCLVAGHELPLGTLLSLVGAPFFLWLIIRHRDEAI